MGIYFKITLGTLVLCLNLQAQDPSSDARVKLASRFQEDANTPVNKELLAKLSIQKRTLDPFGVHQDPNAKPVEKTPDKTPDKPVAEVEILLAKEIGKLRKQIQGIARNRFILNGDFYTRGNQLEVVVKGKVFPLKIVSITPSRITFKNLAKGDLIDLDMKDKNIMQDSPNTPNIPFNKPTGPFQLDK